MGGNTGKSQRGTQGNGQCEAQEERQQRICVCWYGHQVVSGNSGQKDVSGVTVRRDWRGWEEWKARQRRWEWGRGV